MIEPATADLLGYALRAGLIENCDRTWAANRLLQALGLDGWEEPDTVQDRPLEATLKDLPDWAVENGRIEEGTTSRDLFDTELMGRLTPRPSQVIREFKPRYAQSPEVATDW